MTAARWIVVLACVLFATVAIGVVASRLAPIAPNPIERLRAERDAALHALDTLRARHAEREVAASKQADSLRVVISNVRRVLATVGRRADTVLLPMTEYVYVTDTLIPECERCAARVDTLVQQARIERQAASLALVASNAWGQAGYRLYEREARKAKRYKLAVPVALIGGGLLGAHLRGQR